MLIYNFNGRTPVYTFYGYYGHNVYTYGYRSRVAFYSYQPSYYYGYPRYYYGVGGYYSYYHSYYYSYNLGGGNYYYDQYGILRRNYVEWCIIPTGPNYGMMMSCSQCYYRYGACSTSAAFYSASGGSYTVPKGLNRDDIAASGFMPSQFQWPLSMKIISITGPDFNPDYICPPTTPSGIWLAQHYDRAMIFGVDLLATLTQQDLLDTSEDGGSEGGCSADTGTNCVVDADCKSAYGTANMGCWQGTCTCFSNFCFVQTANGLGTCQGFANHARARSSLAAAAFVVLGMMLQ